MLNIIAVTMGDAAGISPEIILKAFLNKINSSLDILSQRKL